LPKGKGLAKKKVLLKGRGLTKNIDKTFANNRCLAKKYGDFANKLKHLPQGRGFAKR
jgi:hypothetical protein